MSWCAETIMGGTNYQTLNMSWAQGSCSMNTGSFFIPISVTVLGWMWMGLQYGLEVSELIF